MPALFSVDRRVEFCETDAAGIAHFSSFMCYMEQAEHAFLRHLGTSVADDIGDGWHLSWPRVHVECDFCGVARFEDVIRVDVRVHKLGSKSVTYGFTFSLRDDCIAEGKVVAVCCRVHPGQPLESTQVPSALRQKFEPYLA